jgi:hypothetical protein
MEIDIFAALLPLNSVAISITERDMRPNHSKTAFQRRPSGPGSRRRLAGENLFFTGPDFPILH